ncbi:MAG TPA: hypothetical protein VNO30_36320 [Kofleriaceae bacterium]|nr:hypothetical protein [Kofleriaceae bacterium]
MMPPDFVFAVTPVADALDAIGVPYYLAGSVISSLHGFARATADVDVVAALRPLHVAQLADRLAGVFYADPDAMADAIRRRAMFNVVHLATMVKVDVYIAATEFDASAMSRHLLKALDDMPGARQFSIATAEDVILHKLTWFRDGGGVSERQWNDVVGVLRVQRGIDLDFLRDWAARLEVTDLLERALLEASR